MPAARPSQASLSNAVSALIDAGLRPAALQVAPDGSFRIELGCYSNLEALAVPQEIGKDSEALTWDEAK